MNHGQQRVAFLDGLGQRRVFEAKEQGAISERRSRIGEKLRPQIWKKKVEGWENEIEEHLDANGPAGEDEAVLLAWDQIEQEEHMSEDVLDPRQDIAPETDSDQRNGEDHVEKRGNAKQPFGVEAEQGGARARVHRHGQA